MKQKIKITKLKRSTMHDLREVLLFHKIRWNNMLANPESTDINNEIIYSLTLKVWHDITAKVSKQYAPNSYNLTLPLHEARLIYNAILAYQVLLDLPFNGELDLLKNEIHQQFTTDYEELTYTFSEDPATSHPLIQIQNQRDPIRIGKSSTT